MYAVTLYPRYTDGISYSHLFTLLPLNDCRGEDRVRHARVTRDEGVGVMVGDMLFEKGLCELVEYYEKNPLHQMTYFKYPINEEVRPTAIHSSS